MKLIQGIIESIKKTRDDTLKEVESLEKRETYLNQSLKALDELYYIGFGLKELKHLINTVNEIAISNGIDYHEVAKKFLKDIEEQYDNKLGFETKIKELKTELEKLESEGSQYKEYLRSKDIVLVLSFLHRNGVTKEDIINMTDVVTAYLNGDIIFNPNLQSGNLYKENRVTNATNNWISFIHELKNLGDINSHIANQSSYLETIKREIDGLYSQRQKLNEQTLLSGQLLNSLNSRLSSFMEFIKQIMFIVYQPLFFINVTAGNDPKDENNDGNIDANDKSL
jgi:hypothetical protein